MIHEMKSTWVQLGRLIMNGEQVNIGKEMVATYLKALYRMSSEEIEESHLEI